MIDERHYVDQVDAFVKGELSDEDEQKFGEALLVSPALQEEVFTTWTLMRGLADQPREWARERLWRGWALAATISAAALALALVFEPSNSVNNPVIALEQHILMPETRGDSQAPILEARDGPITVTIPTSGCSAIREVILSGPLSHRMQALGAGVRPEVALTIPQPIPGDYRLSIHYADVNCPSSHTTFAISDPGQQPGTPSDTSVKKLFEGTWKVRTGSSGLAAPGGRLEIFIESVDGEDHAVFFAEGMGEDLNAAWNSIQNARLVDVAGGLIQGTITDPGGSEHPFTIVRDGRSLRGSITTASLSSRSKVRIQDESTTGEFVADPGQK